MKMISSARMRKAEAALNRARPYEEQLQAILNHASGDECDYVSPLSEERKVKQAALVVLSSNEGLSGAFNLNLFKNIQERIAACEQEGISPLELYTVGKKIRGYVRNLKTVEKREVPEQFQAGAPAEGVKLLTDELIDRFLKGELDRVELVYTRYKSMGSQEPATLLLLPLLPQSERTRKEQAGPDAPGKDRMYLYEPGRREIFDTLYPLIIRTMFYKAFLENHTSEQAARILSMQMASDNATKLLTGLQLDYNKLRQQGITTELLDMAGGSVQD